MRPVRHVNLANNTSCLPFFIKKTKAELKSAFHLHWFATMEEAADAPDGGEAAVSSSWPPNVQTVPAEGVPVLRLEARDAPVHGKFHPHPADKLGFPPPSVVMIAAMSWEFWFRLACD